MNGVTAIRGMLPARNWWWPLAALVLLLAATLVLFQTSYLSMVETWSRSETFTHGFLIAPIALFLVWLKRGELVALAPEPNQLALIPLALLGLAWVMAELVDVTSVRQFAATLMIPALVWLTLGTAVVRVLQFPLAYLLFAVPFGNFLVEPLMDFTADFTVYAVQLTGIPIYRDGLQFELPTGSWSVVEACSGVRYLIASVALGTLYAYIMYRSLWRRLVFVSLAILVPILANGLRAYMIVMIGHLSGMEYAAGVDHLIYGWIFFGLVIFLMFWIGTLWREDDPPAPDHADPNAPVPATSSPRLGRLARATLLGVLVVAAAPAYSEWMNQRDLGQVAGLGDGAFAVGEWQSPADETLEDWRPGYHYARAERGGWVSRTSAEGVAVGAHVAYYRQQHRYGSMVGWDNTLAGRDRSDWSQRRLGSLTLDDGVRVERFRLRGPGRELLVWRLYWVGGALTTSPHEVKVREALQRLLGGRDDAALLVFYAEHDGNPDRVETELRRYAERTLPTLREHLDQVYTQ
ncbi:exosortase A [Thioalkalivibrio sp. ALJT]|uniref:exosortase A n=1 Tax=Thioalkalivibrio sp. ALJT TaxID=1158146 RepID=UPI0003782033|nr:exosortase A [Thioalkalivibrio sp. ALJT]